MKMSRRIFDPNDKINHVCINNTYVQSKILLDIFTKTWDLDHSRLHPGVLLLLVVTVLKSKGDDSKEDASKYDNEDTAQVFEGDSSGILLIFFTVLSKRKVIYIYKIWYLLKINVCIHGWKFALTSALLGFWFHHFSFSPSSFLSFKSFKILQIFSILCMSWMELFYLRIIKWIFKRASLLHSQGVWLLAELISLISHHLQVTLGHSKIPEKFVDTTRN